MTESDGSEHDDMTSHGPIVVLDDELVIALHFADQLEGMGVSNVATCSTAQDVYKMLHADAEAPAYAFLDFNLGRGETSEALARALIARDIPFSFVTGFGTLPAMHTSLSGAECFAKPVKGDTLRGVLERHNLVA